VLGELPVEHRLEIGADLQRVQYRWPVGMPLCRPLGGGLWEVRTNLANATTARVVVCFHGGVIYALHGFIKKTQKTPASDLAVAKDRKKDVENG
jgi:phage-related protein